MVFSSIFFLSVFLPCFLIIYFIVPNKFKNTVLLIFSLIFYAWGEPIYILLMLISTLLNYILAKLIDKSKRKIYLILTIIINLSILGVYKYIPFIYSNINNIFSLSLNIPKITLPIGISFFTFQAMSYTIDVYRGEVKVQKNYFTLLTYICMFPQLIAGPIVRYETIEKEIMDRTVNFEMFSSGLIRFLQGLFKKVLLANTIGLLYDTIIINPLSLSSSWLGATSFALQIYFDFSGYSDMAIGLGKMLGFNYLENFNYPYIATSITDFWRRWHISLSSFFRDYVYIPLGGNRVSKIKNIRNILVVWLLTGLWHGASWNYILWGLYYGIILLIEKFLLKKVLERLNPFIKHIYSIIIILIGWVIFAIEDSTLLINYLKTMFNFTNKIIDNNFIFYLKNYGILIVLGIIFSMPIKIKSENKIFKILMVIGYIILFIISLSLIISDTYNPFLYFRF